jgi:hypothetical protein
VIDPVKFKKILVTILKLLIVFELAGALLEGIAQNQWSRLGADIIIAGVLYLTWERIRTAVRLKKEESRRRIESSTQDIRLWDALIFSLLWSDKIYNDIPLNRKRLVVISYTLIAIGLAAGALQIGGTFMPLVIAGAFVLGGVNLLVWVVSIEREEKDVLQTELKLAHDVQSSLMPKGHPSLEGFDIAGTSVPAREVGGDHFDYSRLGSGRTKFGISVFDVSGKGMQAAMAAVFTSGAYASEAGQSESPAEILTRLNKAVYAHSKRGQFVAYLLASLDHTSRSVTFANAGQSKPLLKSSDTTHWLDSAGVCFPLGMTESSEYAERTRQLQTGDVLFLLTDGFTEAMNEQSELYGNDKLAEFVGKLDTDRLTAQQLLESVIADVRSHTAAASQHDDMTMVVVKVL